MEHKIRLKIINDLGIHARSAARIVELAGRYNSKLYIKKDGHEEVEGDSILSILTLNCPKGAELQARAEGNDSLALLNELSRLFEDRFGEDR